MYVFFKDPSKKNDRPRGLQTWLSISAARLSINAARGPIELRSHFTPNL